MFDILVPGAGGLLIPAPVSSQTPSTDGVERPPLSVTSSLDTGGQEPPMPPPRPTPGHLRSISMDGSGMFISSWIV